MYYWPDQVRGEPKEGMGGSITPRNKSLELNGSERAIKIQNSFIYQPFYGEGETELKVCWTWRVFG